MTEKTKLAVRGREIRAKLAELAGKDELSDEERASMRSLTNEALEVDEKLSALDVSEGSEQRDSQRADLEARCSVGRIFDAVTQHAQIDGAEAELQQELRLASNQVPLALFSRHDYEERAVTPAPTNVGQQQQTIIPGVFPMAAASFLGIDMPTVGVGEAVFPVLTTNATAHTPAEGAAAAETTGSFSADVLSPARIQASFFYSREDRARFAGMDSALRSNLSMALSDGLDKEILAGTAGLLSGTNLANNASSAQSDFANYLSTLAYSRVEGTYVGSTADLRVLVGSPTYAHMGGVYRGNNSEETALDRVQRVTGGVRVSAHVPAVADKKQNAIVRLGARRDAVAPIWEGVTLIPDEITKAGTGEIVVTAVMLYAVKVLRSAGFHKQEFQVAA